MLISNQDKIIFLYNPKTGTRFINSNYSNPKFSHLIIDDKKFNYGHWPINEIIRYRPYTRKYEFVTFIRNPYDRFASATTRYNQLPFRRKNYDIDAMIQFVKGRPDLLFSEKLSIFNYQSIYLQDDRMRILKYENINDWKYACDMLGISFDRVSIKQPYHLSEKQKNEIKELYYPKDKQVFDLYDI